MPRCWLKAEPGDELYIEWSSVVDNPIGVFNAADIARLRQESPTRERFAPERFIRCDKQGSSWGDPHLDGFGQPMWVEDDLVGFGWVSRCDLLAYTLLKREGQHEAAAALVTPIEREGGEP